MESLKSRKKKVSCMVFHVSLHSVRKKTGIEVSSILHFIRGHSCRILDGFFSLLKLSIILQVLKINVFCKLMGNEALKRNPWTPTSLWSPEKLVFIDSSKGIYLSLK